MKAERGVLDRNPAMAGEEVEQGVNRVGRGGQQEGHEHDACIGTAGAPGAEEHNADEGDEDDFRRDSEHTTRERRGQQTEERKDEHGHLHGAHRAAHRALRKAENELKGDGHEDMAGEAAEDAEGFKRVGAEVVGRL